MVSTHSGVGLSGEHIISYHRVFAWQQKLREFLVAKFVAEIIFEVFDKVENLRVGDCVCGVIMQELQNVVTGDGSGHVSINSLECREKGEVGEPSKFLSRKLDVALSLCERDEQVSEFVL